MRYRCATSSLGTTLSRPHGRRRLGEAPADQPESMPKWGADQTPKRIGRLPPMEQDERTAVLSKSFGSVADDYNRLRSGPPSEALDFLLPDGASDVLEIGAGTGILTRLLVERMPHVTAIEPDDRMRALLAVSAPDVEAIEGHAEEIPAPSSSTTWSSPSPPGTGSTRPAPCPKRPACSVRTAASLSPGRGPTAPSAGCARCGRAESKWTPRTRTRWTAGAGGATW